ncbi:MAG: hypothetical protein IIZ08_04520 [Clostridia bacterium]|nr:hypothetical protein [Clostridia bacterium]
MKNDSNLKKKPIGGIVLDIITIGMLFASFAALFYSGFILQTDTFPVGALCAITAVGLLLLFFIGDVSCLSSKVKNNSLTVGFLVFSAIQLVALIVNLTLLFAIMVKFFSVEDIVARTTYVVTTVIVLIGYVMSISYFSDGLPEPDSDSDEDEETADEDEAADEETAVEDEAADEKTAVEDEAADEKTAVEDEAADEETADEDEAADEEKAVEDELVEKA